MNNISNEKLIPKLKEKDFFLIPNRFMDVAAPSIKATGVYVYCLIARCTTKYYYPSVEELAEICKTSNNKIQRIIDELLELGFLNYSDVIEIRKNK